MNKFRKDFTPEQYAQYLENCAKTSKFEHDGLESWEIRDGVKEGRNISPDLDKRNERTLTKKQLWQRRKFNQQNSPVPNKKSEE
jgi:hypothetical protein